MIPKGATKHVRGTSNKNVSGNSYARRARKQWILDHWGNGTHVWCYRCPTLLDFLTLTVDRIIPGARGGKYTRDNIRPSCGPCNVETGNILKAELRAERLAAAG